MPAVHNRGHFLACQLDRLSRYCDCGCRV